MFTDVQRGDADVAGRTSLLEGVKDSKKLSAKKREEWFKILQEGSEFECHHVFVSHEVIKTNLAYGRRLYSAWRKFWKNFPGSPDMVLMDGSLNAPEKYERENHRKGDEKFR